MAYPFGIQNNKPLVFVGGHPRSGESGWQELCLPRSVFTGTFNYNRKLIYEIDSLPYYNAQLLICHYGLETDRNGLLEANGTQFPGYTILLWVVYWMSILYVTAHFCR